MSTWSHIMIHCSDTPSSFDVTPEHIRKWHLEGRGWSRVGYSLLYRRSGIRDILIPFDKDEQVDAWEISNGARGWNGRTRHLCWAGGRGRMGGAEDNRTHDQHIMMVNDIKLLLMLFPKVQLIGHNQVNKGKYCPAFNVPQWAESIGIESKNIDYKTYY